MKIKPKTINFRKYLFFLIAISAILFLNVFAFQKNSTQLDSDSTSSQVVQNDVFWKDMSGSPIYSQGGGVLKVGSTYYWYGVKYSGAVTYYNNPGAGKNSGYQFSAITCYSSTDLAHWKFEGNVMTTSDGLGGWVGRVGAAYNSNTHKYVLLAQYGSDEMFATSSTPSGHFTLQGTQSSIGNVVNDMSGDQSVFVDSDGKAYLVRCRVKGATLRPANVQHAFRSLAGTDSIQSREFSIKRPHPADIAAWAGWKPALYARHCTSADPSRHRNQLR